MKGLLYISSAQLGGFLISSFLIVGYRTTLADIPCDPKFQCLCSLTCMIAPIAICTLILALGISVSYLIFGRGNFGHLKQQQSIMFFVAGTLLSLLVFAHPLPAIVIIYGGQLIIWLPISIAVSLITIKGQRIYRPDSARSVAFHHAVPELICSGN